MAFLRKRSTPPASAAPAIDQAAPAADQVAAEASTPDPTPAATLLLADIALRGGAALLSRAVETGLLGATANGKRKAADIIKGRSLAQGLVGTAIARLATRSVPGALIVGGGLLAKTLHDRKRARAARAEGKAETDGKSSKGRN
ncbi:hypothetical protein ACFOD9_13515 [Novosphingobium bradum]|uniref:DUF4235 domain-containing protein n=1 Tax=Novosphingobium bradum TaxID=1737444 RepID=A0ABV7IUN0_9SPHN